ncbi:MAG: polysaccharide deacetylase family protein [Firmicutes bacterium]|nr:polysaccharide deacetylase family protein [Bacillota bacterium]
MNPKKPNQNNIFAFFALAALLMLLAQSAAAANSDGERKAMSRLYETVGGEATPYSWYTVRTKDNTTPPIASELSFITEHGGYYADTDAEARGDRVLYLTFDAGYENGNIEKILDTLKEKGVTGAFFILENMIERFPALVLRMKDEGHLVCNHTSDHHDMSSVTDFEVFSEELTSLDEKYRALTGESIAPYYRPPEGKFTELNLEYAQKLGYDTIFWSLAYADWDNDAQPSREYAIKKLSDNTHSGAVILLHPTSSTNAEILGEMIDIWRNDGYRFGTLDELTGK